MASKIWWGGCWGESEAIFRKYIFAFKNGSGNRVPAYIVGFYFPSAPASMADDEAQREIIWRATGFPDFGTHRTWISLKFLENLLKGSSLIQMSKQNWTTWVCLACLTALRYLHSKGRKCVYFKNTELGVKSLFKRKAQFARILPMHTSHSSYK